MEAPHFWDDAKRSQEITKKMRQLEATVKQYRDLETTYEDIQTMIEMAEEENDASLVPEISEMLDTFCEELDELRMQTLLNDEYDSCNAILRLNAGAGGTESCDWAGMLYRMYNKFADRHNFTVEVLDMLEGDEAGIKSVTFQINGENAYGLLKSEHGVHRLRFLRRNAGYRRGCGR